MRKGVANDPSRRDRIAQAALDLLAEEGLRGTTHRRIAERAGVPLGSVTYHFDGLEDIFIAAFERLAEQMDPHYGTAISAAGSQAEAREVLVDAICGDGRATEREARLLRELYAYGSISPRAQDLIRSFEERAIAALMTQFPEPAARALDALVEGWWIYQSWTPGSLDPAMVRRAVDALVDAFTDHPVADDGATAPAPRP